MTAMSDSELRAFLSAGTRTGKVAWVGADGQPRAAPIWFVVDHDDAHLTVLFNTGAQSAKGRAMARDPRICLVVDDERPPFAFAQLTGPVELVDDPDQLRSSAATIGARYMGAERAEEFGIRNGVPGELLVRFRPSKVIAERGVAE